MRSEKVSQIGRSLTVQGSVSNGEDLKLKSNMDREPVEGFEYRCNMRASVSSGDESSCSILDCL